MSIAFVVSATAASGNTNDVTTAGVNTTGANLLVVGVADYVIRTVGTLTDSKSNTWTALSNSGTTLTRCVLFYCKNPTVGSGHTFTYTGSVQYPAIAMMAFSGADTSAPFDAEAGGTQSGGTTLQGTSLTVANNNEVAVSVLAYDANNAAPSINSSYSSPVTTNYSGGANFGISMSYLIPSAQPTQPTWSWANSTDAATRNAAFKASGGSTNTLTPAAGSLTLTGQTSTLKKSVAPASTALSFSALTSKLKLSVAPTSTALALSGQTSRLKETLAPASHALSLTGLTSTVSVGQFLRPSTGTLVFAALTSALKITERPAAGTLTLTGMTSTVVVDTPGTETRRLLALIAVGC